MLSAAEALIAAAVMAYHHLLRAFLLFFSAGSAAFLGFVEVYMPPSR